MTFRIFGNHLRIFLVIVTLLGGVGLSDGATAPKPSKPSVLSKRSLVATGTIGEPFTLSFTSAFTKNATTFTAEGLPNGLTSGTDGVVSGTPTVRAVKPQATVLLRSSNDYGSSMSKALHLTIKQPAPDFNIPQDLILTATYGNAFSYTIPGNYLGKH
jgi:hypothetical protein